MCVCCQLLFLESNWISGNLCLLSKVTIVLHLVWYGGRRPNVHRGFFNTLIFVMHSPDMHGFCLNAGSVSSRMFPVILSVWHWSSTLKPGLGLSFQESHGSTVSAVPPFSCKVTFNPSFVSAHLAMKLRWSRTWCMYGSLHFVSQSFLSGRLSVCPSCMQSGGRHARPREMFDTNVLLPCEGCRNCPYLHPKRLLYFSIIYICVLFVRFVNIYNENPK